MLSTNAMKITMKVSAFLYFVFIISPSYGSALTIENILQKKGHSEWRYFFISKPFNATYSNDSEKNIEKLFDGKKIIFNNNFLTITDACTYKYSAQLVTPLTFWSSAKTVNFYKVFFSDYKIKMPSQLLNISPVDPSEKCEHPFSEFIVLDNEIVFFYENNAVFYFKDQKALNFHKNINKDAITDTVLIKPSKVCKKIERDDDNYNTSLECFYKGASLLDAYQEYRKELMSDDYQYFPDKLIANKNLSIKCENGCIEIYYKWNGPDNLIITQMSDGGETEISFSEETHGCRVLTKLFPD